MSKGELVRLEWCESQVAHCWRSAGYTARQISEGMSIPFATVCSEVYTRSKKARKDLQKLPCWAGTTTLNGRATQSQRRLTPHEAEAVVLWLEVGRAPQEIADAMSMHISHVRRFADLDPKRKTQARKRLEERSAFAPRA